MNANGAINKTVRAVFLFSRYLFRVPIQTSTGGGETGGGENEDIHEKQIETRIRVIYV